MYELCWHIGGDRCIHPDYLSAYLTQNQIAGWVAWLKKEPRGDRRADVRSAVQTAYIRQCFTEGSEDPETFLPRFKERYVFKDPEVEQLVDDFMRPI